MDEEEGRTGKVLASGAALALGVGLGFGAPAEAATFVVSNLNDAGPGSLRQAIADANDAPGADVITFQAGLTGTIRLTGGQLEINDSVDIQGPGAEAVAVDGDNHGCVFYLYSDSDLLDVTLSGLTVAHGRADQGAGILDWGEGLTLDHVTVQNNAAVGDEGGSGGGIALQGSTGGLTIRNSLISGNDAEQDGGGIYVEDAGLPVLIQGTVVTGNHAGDTGGGVYLEKPGHAVTIERSTISGNTADCVGGGIYLYQTQGGTTTIRQTTLSGNTATEGGGAYFYSPRNPLAIENSTVSGNHATAGSGGGIYIHDSGAILNLRSSTIASNDATGPGGGIFFAGSHEGESVDVRNSILAGNTAGTGASDLDGQGTFNLEYSLVQTPGDAHFNDIGGNILGQDPLLGPLGNHGGPTQTQLPAVGSPAIDAGDPAITPSVATDQRDLDRVVNGRIDLGAVEVGAKAAEVAMPVSLPNGDAQAGPPAAPLPPVNRSKALLGGLLGGLLTLGGLLLLMRRRGSPAAPQVTSPREPAPETLQGPPPAPPGPPRTPPPGP